MRKDPEIKIHSQPGVLEIVAFPAKCNETIALYVRENQVILCRHEGEDTLEGAIFGCACMRVFRDWIENPMPEGTKVEAKERWKMLRGER